MKLPARKTAAEKAHLARVAAMHCLICRMVPVEVHHVVGYADRMGRAPKRHDRVVPLCVDHHRLGPVADHNISHQGFFRMHGIDLMAEAERLADG